MDHIVITGAQGFVGQAPVQRLLAHGLGGRPVRRLTLVDVGFAAPPADPRVRQLPGSIGEAALRRQA